MKKLQTLILGIGLSSGSGLFAQTQTHYFGTNVTGQLSLTAASPINLLTLSQNAPAPAPIGSADFIPETLHVPYKRPTLPVQAGIASVKIASTPGLSVAAATSVGFDGLTHANQRLANGGYQWSTEPATPGIAVNGNYVVEGVDDAIEVYNTSGTPSLPIVVSTNQFFGLLPAINRANPNATFCPGPYLTDMRVFYDPDIQRFIVIQWGQPQGYYSCDNLDSSTEWIAVTQTSDPTGNWNIYSMNTTDFPGPSGCPCVPDYPQIGADLNAFYISSNEFDAATETEFTQSNILVISKADLQSGADMPSMVRFVLPNVNGFQFSVQPAVTPPNATYYLANGGLEYFVSSLSGFSLGNSLALYAMTNTSSINTLNQGVSLLLTQTTVTTESYNYPGSATEPTAASYPLGQSMFDAVPLLSGGPDSRTLSNVYAGGRLYITLPSQVTDGNGNSVVGGAYIILSPTYRGGSVSASVLRQGYLAVNSNHILRPFAAVTGTVNGQVNGAIVFTLVGPSYYPSAAWLPFNNTTTGSTIQLAGVGAGPEDGFTGYENPFTGQTLIGSTGIARWGDNSAAVVAADGSIWGTTEYIPNLPRTTNANWGTYIMHINP